MERDYNDVQNCELCDKPFNITRVRHKCKRCRIIICADCGLNRTNILVEGEFLNTVHRVCNPCWTDISYRIDFEKNNDVVWNSSSQKAQSWYKKITAEEIVNDYKTQIAAAHNDTDFAPIIQNIKTELKTSKFLRGKFNYSLNEFMYNAQLELDNDRILGHISNVLVAFLYKTKIPYNTLIPRILTFLLSLCEEQVAYTMLMFLYEKVLPKGFWNRGEAAIPFEGFQREKYVILKYLKDKLFFSTNKEMRQYFDNVNTFLDGMLGGFMVNICSFELLMKIWDDVVLVSNIRILQFYILKVVWKLKPFLESTPNLSFKNIQTYICRNLNTSAVKNVNIEFNAIDKAPYEVEWKKESKELRESRQIGVSLLYSITPEQVKTYLFEVSELIKGQYNEKREVMGLTKVLFSMILKIVGLSEKQSGAIFDVLDYFGTGTIGSQRFSSAVLYLTSKGDIEAKINEVFKLKNVEKGLDQNAFIKCVDYTEDAFFFSNHISYVVGLKEGWLEFKDQLHFKTRENKSLSFKDFSDVFKENPFLATNLEAQQIGVAANIVELEKSEMLMDEKEVELKQLNAKLQLIQEDASLKIKALEEKALELENQVADQALDLEKKKNELIKKYEAELAQLKNAPEVQAQLKSYTDTVDLMKQENLRLKKEYEKMKSMESLYLQEIKQLTAQIPAKKK